jgi:Condensation domain
MSIAANMAPNFRLDQLPLVAAIVFKLGGNNYGCNITLNHIMTNDVSLGIFFELFELCMHGADSLPPGQLHHYSDFSNWLKRTADHQKIHNEQLRYWVKTLEGVGC